MIHRNITGPDAIHQASYIQTADPGAVGAWKIWIDITSPSAPVFNYRNAGDSAWVTFNPAVAAHNHSAADITSGTLADARFPATLPAASGVNLTALNASNLASGIVAIARLATGTPDGTKFIRDDGTLQVPAGGGGGGGGGGEFVDEAPASPEAEDDEFTAGTLDAKWTVDTTPHANFTTYPNRGDTYLSMKGLGNASADWILRQPLVRAAGVAVGITIKGHVSSTANGPWVALSIQNVSTKDTGSYITGYIACESSAHVLHTWDGSSNPGVQTSYRQTGTFYIHMERDTSNNVSWWHSHNGIAWMRGHTAARAWDINYFFLHLHGNTGGGEFSQQWIDWIRIDDPRYNQLI